MPPRSPALVIFDCDGVLVDSETVAHEVLRRMLAELGVEMTLEAAFGHFMGSSTAKCLQTVERLLGAPAPPGFMADYGRRSFEAFGQSLGPVPGVVDLLPALQQPFCVASNGPRTKMRFTLGHTGLLPWFEGRLFSADDVARPKPAPDLFLHAARTLGAAAADCVVVEDSPTGVAAARAAGMAVLGYAGLTPAARLREAGAQHIVGHMAELHEILSTR